MKEVRRPPESTDKLKQIEDENNVVHTALIGLGRPEKEFNIVRKTKAILDAERLLATLSPGVLTPAVLVGNQLDVPIEPPTKKRKMVQLNLFGNPLSEEETLKYNELGVRHQEEQERKAREEEIAEEEEILQRVRREIESEADSDSNSLSDDDEDDEENN